jgi:hypothetical protein
MKKLMLVLISGMFVCGLAFAQEEAAPATTDATVAATTATATDAGAVPAPAPVVKKLCGKGSHLDKKTGTCVAHKRHVVKGGNGGRVIVKETTAAAVK